MKIIDVYGVGNCGKSSTLLIFKSLPGFSTVKEYHSVGCSYDVVGLYKYSDGLREYVFVISTCGDSIEGQNAAFDLYDEFKGKYKVDAIIVAGRTRGATGGNLHEHSKKLGSPLYFYSKGYIHYDSSELKLSKSQMDALYKSMNEREAQNILELAIC